MASLRSGTVRAGASRLEALRMRQCWLSAPCMPFGSHKSYKAPCQDKSALTVIGRPCRVNANFVALDLWIGIPKHLRAQRRALPASGDGPAEGALPACRRGRERLAAPHRAGQRPQRPLSPPLRPPADRATRLLAPVAASPLVVDGARSPEADAPRHGPAALLSCEAARWDQARPREPSLAERVDIMLHLIDKH